ncbi:D-aminoacyl-tRNA deacylase [Vicingaceae bacterium]|nr:D-aminoacyl-tRNA deacylase [Vicingaceae bacterium]
MRIVLQRVLEASVTISGVEKARIDKGLLLLLGIETADSKEDRDWLIRKVINMRIFNDDEGVMNLSVKDIAGEIVVVSQFTLHASTKRGNRPSYINAAPPEMANEQYELFKLELAAELGKSICCGEFGADMKVKLINDGPVTILLDSKNKE